MNVASCAACADVCRGGDGAGSRCGGARAPVGVQLEPFKTNAGTADPKAACSPGLG